MIHRIVDAIGAAEGDVVHVRNKQVEARELLALARHYVGLGRRVVVNTRVDVALAAGAMGAHLPADAIGAARWRTIVPADFLLGVSCHSREELLRAEAEGADYAYLSPVFAPFSKQDTRSPLGLDGFAEAVRGVRMPVLALGGITLERIEACRRAGAAGVAAITLPAR